MAHGNFFPTMQLEQGGQEVCGPIVWAGSEVWDLPALEVEIVVVVVTQFTRGGLIIGTTQGSTTFSHGSQLQDEWETDVFDRRAMRNLIRSGEVQENDRVRVDDAEPVVAGSISFIKGLFGLRKNARVNPPTCCRTHTERVAHFKCRDSVRPLCEECAPEKKFGQTIIRVCGHCGGTATEMVAPELS